MMKIELTQKPKNPTIIEGFPGFGLVATIATEFLVKHLNAVKIGQIWDSKLLPMAAIHDSRVLDPLGIYYCKKHNIILVHALSNVKTMEWDIADSLIRLSSQLNAKEVISLEGVGSQEGKLRTFYYTDDKTNKTKMEKIGLLPLKEGIIMGVTGALLLKRPPKVSCIFVESQMGLADSKAAAKIIQVLDNYLGLKVDTGPLLKAATQFESKLKGVFKKGKLAMMQRDQKNKQMEHLSVGAPNYFG